MSLLPRPLPETQPYWDAAAAETLAIQRCGACGNYYFPPAPVCPHCTSRHVSWEQVSGRATLYSYVITANLWPVWELPPPFSVATIALEEGPRLLSTVLHCEQTPAALKIDMPLQAMWHTLSGGLKLLCFRPAGERGQ